MKNTLPAHRLLATSFAEQAFRELNDSEVISVQDWDSLLRRFQQALDGVFPVTDAEADGDCLHFKTWGY